MNDEPQLSNAMRRTVEAYLALRWVETSGNVWWLPFAAMALVLAALETVQWLIDHCPDVRVEVSPR